MSLPLRSRLRGPLRIALHGAGLFAGWCLFAYFWFLVAQQALDSRMLRWLFAAAAVLVPVVTGAWVWHNRGIYRRLGPRTGQRRVEARYDHDFYGRHIDADWAALNSARYIVIEQDTTHKRYRSQDLPTDAP